MSMLSTRTKEHAYIIFIKSYEVQMPFIINDPKDKYSPRKPKGEVHVDRLDKA